MPPFEAYDAWLDRYWRPYVTADPIPAQQAVIEAVLDGTANFFMSGRGAGKTTLKAAMARYVMDDDGIEWLPAWQVPTFPRSNVPEELTFYGLEDGHG